MVRTVRVDPAPPSTFCSSGKQIGLSVPLMAEVAHDESVVESHTACGKCRLIGEERRFDILNRERAHLPTVSLKPDPIKTVTIAGGGVANVAALKIGGRLGQRVEARGLRQQVALVSAKGNRHASVARADIYGNAVAIVGDDEICE